jgi:alkylation response protein AidB-like acyl-CoA dehydrogenase
VDFALSETQQAVAQATADVLDRGQPPPVGQHEPGQHEPGQHEPGQHEPGQHEPGQHEPGQHEPGQHEPGSALWKELGQAGLLSLTLPAWLDGDELGVPETAVLLTEVGRRAAAVPALATLMLGVLPVVRWGGRDLQESLLSQVGSGDTVLTAAVREPSAEMPAAPATVASLTGDSGPGDSGPGSAGPGSAGTVTGTKIGVPYAAEARWILVPASVSAGGRAVVIVAAHGAGVGLHRTPTSAGTPEYTVRLTAAPVAGVLDAGAAGDVVGDLYQLALAGACCLADGALSAALALTTAHIAAREQFGRPLATFQAVAQQIADVYIAARTLHLVTLSACWRLATGREAGGDLDVAAYWLAQEAPAALRTCHHLHGGIGLDVTYPLHRYSSLIVDLARLVGGADHRLDALGARTSG